jgi:eukaryotic-like serine/threonine-protein kinase
MVRAVREDERKMTADEPGASIRAFEILTKLSSGGMGDVLLARRHGAHGFEKLLAVKTIRGDLAKRPDIRAMFLDEARLVARLDHPAIAHVYDFGEEDETLYLAMEYVAGVALNKLLIKRQAPLPPPVAVRIAAEVCRGIHAAHELTDLDGRNLGVVHRDLSPGNLILTFDGHMKILDFGIAFMNERESPDTQLGELKGKPSYMAPEQLRAERVDRRSDLYSLSVVLHEMLTGRKLFTKNNVVATVLAVERGDVPKPTQLNPALPACVDATVMKGLAKNAPDRYQNAREMAAALDKLVVELGGDLTLERFVDLELVEEQRVHKSWMNQVLSGVEDPGTYERFLQNVEPVVTKNETVPKPAAEEARPLVESTTLVPPPPTADVVALGKKKSATKKIALVVGVLIAFLFGTIAFVASNRDPIPPIEAEPIAKEAPMPVLDLPPPAAVEVAPAPDPEPEQQTTRVVKRKKHRKHKRSEVEDNAPPAGPATFGFLTVGASPYALVRIDGKEIGATPIWSRKLPVGRHEIQLVAPDSGEVRLTKILKIEEGQLERITLE